MGRSKDLADLGAVTSRLDTVGASSGALSNRNIIINGAMNLAQRGTSSTSSGVKTIDRFAFNASNYDEAAFTQAQSSLAPSGFSKSYRIDCTTIESALAADEIANVSQAIEAQNLQHIQNGSSGAKSLTLSFWVKSNKTGAFTVNFYKPDNTARHISSTYTINSADTWEYKTITVAGDTDGGGIANDNGAGLYLYWILSAGSDYTSSDSTSWGNYANAGFAYGHTVNIFDNTANDWAVTGVQLEVGDTATDFEHEPYSVTLAKAQRYFYQFESRGFDMFFDSNVTVATSEYKQGGISFPVEMRATPASTGNGTALTTSNLESPPPTSMIGLSRNHASFRSRSASTGRMYLFTNVGFKNNFDAEL